MHGSIDRRKRGRKVTDFLDAIVFAAFAAMTLAGALETEQAMAGDSMKTGSRDSSLLAPDAIAYFVDPTAGDDNHDGLSPQKAWRTWGQFEKHATPGAALLLKRGCAYALPLPLVGGTAELPIVYGAYGEGAKPILNGNLRNLSQLQAWKQERTGLWRTASDMPEAANLIFNDTICGNMRYKQEDLHKPGQWFQAATGTGPLLVCSTGNPAQAWQKIELVASGNGITVEGKAHAHIRFTDLRIQKVGTHGIRVVSGASDIAIRGGDLALIGGAVFRFDAFSASYGPQFVERRVRFGNAIEAWENVSDVTVEDCRISEIFDGGFCLQGYPGSVARNLTVRNNVFWNCGYDSLDVAHGICTHHVLFEHNTCVNAGEGWAMQDEPWPRYSLNIPDSVGFHLNLESSSAWDKRCEVIARDNIFFNAPKSRCMSCGPGVLSKLIEVDHNCYFQPSPADAITQIDGKPFSAERFDDYKKLTGWDEHSIIADPGFVDAAAGDFRLKAGSPCLGLGASGNVASAPVSVPGK